MARASLSVMWVTLIISVLCLMISAYYSVGFMGGGRSFIGVLQGVLISFGLGACLYGPAIAVFFMARYVRANGPKRWIGGLTLLLVLPILGYAIAAIHYKIPFLIVSVLAILVGIYLSFWAVLIVRHGT